MRKLNDIGIQHLKIEIQPDLPISIGCWILEKYSVYNPYSGVINIQSKCFKTGCKKNETCYIFFTIHANHYHQSKKILIEMPTFLLTFCSHHRGKFKEKRKFEK